MSVKLRWFRSTRHPVNPTPPPPRPAPRFRPCVEGFEDRVVPAAPAALSPALAAPAAAAPASILPISITNVINNNGVLTANGLLGNTAFQGIPVGLGLSPNSTATTPILDLHLGEIHLDVLGLNVDTSEICLAIDATSGQGQLLGNLLTGVANLLNGGTSLGTILGGLGNNLNTLLGGLAGLLNGALGAATAPTSVAGVSPAAAAGTTQILNLSLGPIDLNLLGLGVHLDDCDNGPVTVDISAQAGPGKLLGNLLTSVAHLLDGPANGNALNNAIGRVTNAINGLLNI